MAKQIRIIKGTVTSGSASEGYPIQTIFTITSGRSARVHISHLYHQSGFSQNRLWITGMGISSSHYWFPTPGWTPGPGLNGYPNPSPDSMIGGSYAIPRIFYMNGGESLYFQNQYYYSPASLCYNICIIEEY